MIVFRLFFKYLGRFFKFFFRWGAILPAGLFIVTEFFINLIRANFTYAFSETAKTLFSAELVINEMVHLAIANSSSYTIISFIRILISLYILYALVKFIGKVLIKFTGSQAEAMAYVVGLIIVAIIEISAIAVIDKQFGFFPIYNGLIFLFMNLKPVIFNIFSFGVASSNISNIVINTTNTTGMTLGLFFRRKDI